MIVANTLPTLKACAVTVVLLARVSTNS